MAIIEEVINWYSLLIYVGWALVRWGRNYGQNLTVCFVLIIQLYALSGILFIIICLSLYLLLLVIFCYYYKSVYFSLLFIFITFLCMVRLDAIDDVHVF